MKSKKSSVIILYSGGVDSTYILYNYLKNTDYNIYCHYVSIKYTDNLYRASDLAVNNCISWLTKNCRSFNFSKSDIDFTFCDNNRSDYQILALVASQLVIKTYIPNPLYVIIGILNTDTEVKNRRNRFNSIYKSIFHNNTVDPIPVITPIFGQDKNVLYNYLPKELSKLVWSCRHPIFIKNIITPCNKCHSCKEYKKANLVHNIINLN